jgi:hypothetical protein
LTSSEDNIRMMGDFDNAAWPLLIFEFGPTLHV